MYYFTKHVGIAYLGLLLCPGVYSMEQSLVPHSSNSLILKRFAGQADPCFKDDGTIISKIASYVSYGNQKNMRLVCGPWAHRLGFHNPLSWPKEVEFEHNNEIIEATRALLINNKPGFNYFIQLLHRTNFFTLDFENIFLRALSHDHFAGNTANGWANDLVNIVKKTMCAVRNNALINCEKVRAGLMSIIVRIIIESCICFKSDCICKDSDRLAILENLMDVLESNLFFYNTHQEIKGQPRDYSKCNKAISEWNKRQSVPLAIAVDDWKYICTEYLLFNVAVRYKRSALIDYFKKSIFKISILKKEHGLPIMATIAAYEGDIALVESLVSHDYKKQIEAVRLLIEQNVDESIIFYWCLNGIDDVIIPAYISGSVSNNQVEMSKWLLARGVELQSESIIQIIGYGSPEIQAWFIKENKESLGRISDAYLCNSIKEKNIALAIYFLEQQGAEIGLKTINEVMNTRKIGFIRLLFDYKEQIDTAVLKKGLMLTLQEAATKADWLEALNYIADKNISKIVRQAVSCSQDFAQDIHVDEDVLLNDIPFDPISLPHLLPSINSEKQGHSVQLPKAVTSDDSKVQEHPLPLPPMRRTYSNNFDTDSDGEENNNPRGIDQVKRVLTYNYSSYDSLSDSDDSEEDANKGKGSIPHNKSRVRGANIMEFTSTGVGLSFSSRAITVVGGSMIVGGIVYWIYRAYYKDKKKLSKNKKIDRSSGSRSAYCGVQ